MKIYLRYPPCNVNILSGILLWKAYCEIIGTYVWYQHVVGCCVDEIAFLKVLEEGKTGRKARKDGGREKEVADPAQ